MNKKIFYLLLFSVNISANPEILDSTVKSKLNVIGQRAYSTISTLYNTYSLAIDCLANNLPGDFVECGVAGGAQVAVMGYACQKINKFKTIHLFDSFEGIPLAGPNDDQQPGIGAINHGKDMSNPNNLLVTSGISAHSVEQVKSHMKEWKINENYLVYHKGWFQNTLPVAVSKIDKICFLRLDGDLYESTKVCLEYLYPKVCKDGFIVIDDYALPGCKKAVDEYLKKNNLSPKIQQVSGGLGPVFWKKD